MNSIKRKTARKITSVLLSASTMVWLVGGSALIPTVASADAATDALIAQLQAQIAALSAQLAALAGGSSTVPSSACSFTRNLTLGSQGSDVTCLQNYLTGTGHFTFSGGATGYFGNVTKNAVAAWQAANGVAPAAGYFGAISRAKYSSLVSSMPSPTPTVPGGPTPTPGTGTSLMVSAGTQPANSLAPEGAARIPFTRIVVTAGNDGDVVLNGVTVERTGLANDAVFDGVVLMDENGVQIGLSKTLNSEHKAIVGEAVTIPRGTSKTFTIGGNMLSGTTALDAYAGQVAYLTVVGVNTSAGVSGSFPITGAGHTINGSLTIGSVTMGRGALEPGVAATKRLDTVAYTFSSIKVTAGSAEKVLLKYVRWYQSGSASASDLANIKVVVDGTEYVPSVSADGKYYTATFPGNGLLIDKGFSKDISIKGDIVGGTSRTVAFDVAKRTDVGVVGETYGYGIIPPQTGSSATATGDFTNTEDPWFDGSVVTIGVGTLLVNASNSAAAQNIAINLANQNLGAFEVVVKGESISVSRLAFNITLGSEGANDDVDDLTNVSIVDANGAVVAGPVDGSATDSSYTASSGDGSIVFTDTITFPVGTNVYYLKGKVGTDIDNNVTIIASTTPSSDFAGTVRGSISGNTITPDPTSAITMSTMTVKSGSVTISVSSIPIAQTVIAGVKGFLFANYILDAGASGEDVRFASFPAEFNAPASFTYVTNCALYDGSTVISNTQNPTGAASSTNFTFTGSGLTIGKGTSKTLGLMCDVGSGATGDVRWGYDSSSDPSPTGLTSGQSIAETENDGEGQRMTFSTGGSFTVALDASSPSYAVVNSGATVELGKLRFTASNEEIDVKQVALQLTGNASNTPNDLVGRMVTLWDGATQVGSAVFSTGDYATSSAVTNFRIPRDGSKVMTIKGEIAGVSNSGPLTASGDFLTVNYDGDNEGLNGNYGTGVASGSTITPASGDSSVSGARIMKAYPSFTAITGWQPATLVNGDQPLYRFSVRANGGDVGLSKFVISIATTSVDISGMNMFAYTDSGFSSPISGVNTGGQLVQSNLETLESAWSGTEIDVNIDSSGTATVLQVPSGSTYYFEVRGNVSGANAANDSVSTQLLGDAAYPVAHQSGLGAGTSGDMGSVAGVEGDANDDFIWTPNSTTTVSSTTAYDFTNGYGLTGLPAGGMNAQTLSR